jgi:exopolysaccharide biosynthesis polyprenyl glycosylphosphotransferase
MMSPFKWSHKVLSFVFDFLFFNVAFFLWLLLRIRFGFYAESDAWTYGVISMTVSLFWTFLFIFFGMYKHWETASRLDEVIDVAKTVTAGIFVIFIVTFDIEKDVSSPFKLSRLILFGYWVIMIATVGVGRFLLHTAIRKLIEKGVWRRKTLIVGWGEKAWELCDQIAAAPALGYRIEGFVSHNSTGKKGSYRRIPVIGVIGQLNRLIQAKSADEILIALPRRSERKLQEVIAQCNGLDVGIKIVPDLYNLMVGQVRTNQIYGFPLIEILPHLITPWERVVKRIGDVLFSLVVIAGFMPFWIFIAALIKLDSRGPVFYRQERVGKDGKLFSILKYRSMIHHAEKRTGPVWASDRDPRITRIGRWLRKLRIDEFPQFLNVLVGDMSLVGPRPERPFFVEKLKKVYPLYSRRLQIRPGITGWAQVKGEYDQTLEDVKQKLEYDLFYLENMSLRMDLKIILNTIYVILTGKGQ